MQKFNSTKSQIIPLPLRDIDTDMIIPAQFLTAVSSRGYGDNLFRRLKDSDPQFPLNLPKYKGATILVAGNNFGCGSSREHAVWALRDAGIQVVIASAFADIFHGNALKNGLVPVQMEEVRVQKILQGAAQGDSYQVEVSLDKQLVTLPDDEQIPFDFDSFRKHCILNGLDDLEYILSHRNEIAAHFAKTA